MVRDVGDSMRLEYVTLDTDNEPVAATVVLTVTKPNGTTSTPTVTTPSTGHHRASFTLDAAGTWTWVWESSGTVVDAEYGSVEASAEAAEGATWYTTLAEVKTACGVAEDDREKDDLIRKAIAAASRSIDDRCGAPRRRFYRDADVSSRIFSASKRSWWDGCTGEYVFEVDDLASVEDLVLEVSTNGTTWTTVTASVTACGPDDDRNAPGNLRAVVELRSYGAAWWAGGRLVRITERWGWPAVPDTIGQGALLQSSRLFARRNSPEGVLGNAEWGIARVSRLDPDVRAMIGAYILDGIA